MNQTQKFNVGDKVQWQGHSGVVIAVEDRVFIAGGEGVEDTPYQHVKIEMDELKIAGRTPANVIARPAEELTLIEAAPVIEEVESAMNELLANIEGIDGMQATYGGGDYTVTVWENMDDGYDVVFHRSNSDIAFNRIDGLSADETIAKMAEYQSDASKWHAVEFES